MDLSPFKILFLDPLVEYPTKLYPNGKRSDVGIRWSVAYLIGYLRKDLPSFEYAYKSYKYEEYCNNYFDIEKDIKDYDIICIGACTSEIPHALEISKISSSLGKVVIMGGLFASSNPNYVLNTNYVDYIVIGEGEETLHELLYSLYHKTGIQNIKGIAYRASGDIIINPPRPYQGNIDKFVPTLDIFPTEEFSELNLGTLYSSRGCTLKCSFCTPTKHWGYTSRYHSIDHVMNLLKYFDINGFKRIHFLDESITSNKNRAEELFKKIRECNFNFKIKIKSRLFDLDDDILDVLAASGVYIIQCGIESLSFHKSEAYRKQGLIQDIQHKIGSITRRGINLNLIYQLGMENQDYSDLMVDRDFIISNGMNPNILTYLCFHTPHPNNSSGELGYPRFSFLTGDLNNFTHKRIVGVPKIMGKTEYSLRVLHDTYNTIVRELDNEEVNPIFDLDYILSVNPNLSSLSCFNHLDLDGLEISSSQSLESELMPV